MSYHRRGMAGEGKGRLRALTVAVLCAAALGAGVTQALAADATVTGEDSSFGPPPFNQPSIPQGGTLEFRNNDSISHNVVARGRGPDGSSLFRSPTFAGPEARGVAGVQYLSAGSYPFLCTLHPTSMQGTLVVRSEGTPVARPKIQVAILSTRLNRVVTSRRLLVRVKAATTARDVSLRARRGTRTVTRGPELDLVAGATRKVKLPVTKAGRKLLDGLGSATLKLIGTVPFGPPDTARKSLR